jgi:ABC-2 type transport system ATP-binding protein
MCMNQESNPYVVVKFEGLTRRFGSFTAVSNLSFEIRKGEVVGLLGPNGAGKSTTMKMMAHLIRPTEGKIYIEHNNELVELTSKTKDTLLDKFGFLIENPAFYEDVTPRQILSYFAQLRGYPRAQTKKRVEECMEMMHLTEWIDKKIATFSKGMRQKIGILSTIVHDPQVIILDEPQTGLDPKARIEIRNFIKELKNSGKTVFLSSHQLHEISEVADRVVIINRGQLIAFDTVDNLEAKAKKSVIQMELLNSKGKETEIERKVESILKNIQGIETQNNIVRYDKATGLYEIFFNGNRDHQSKILRALVAAGLEITEFSVPKTGLLETLYLELVKEGGN